MVYTTGMDDTPSETSQVRRRVEGLQVKDGEPGTALENHSHDLLQSDPPNAHSSSQAEVLHYPPVLGTLPYTPQQRFQQSENNYFVEEYSLDGPPSSAAGMFPAHRLEDPHCSIRSSSPPLPESTSDSYRVPPVHYRPTDSLDGRQRGGGEACPPQAAQLGLPRHVIEAHSAEGYPSSTPALQGDVEADVVPGDAGVPQQETAQSQEEAGAVGTTPSYFNIQPRPNPGQPEPMEFTEDDYKKGKLDPSGNNGPRRPQQATTPDIRPARLGVNHPRPSGVPVGPNTYAMGGGGIHVYNFGNVNTVNIGNSKRQKDQSGNKRNGRPQRNNPRPVQGRRKGSPPSTKTKKLLVPRRTVRTDDLDFVATHLGHNWRYLGRKLGFSKGQLDTFENDYQGMHEQIFAMLDAWTSRMEEPSIKDLVKALVDANCVDVAQMMADKEAKDEVDPPS